LATLAVMCW